MKIVSNFLKSYVFDAILLIVLGIVLLIWPTGALMTIFKWIGIALIVLGVIKGFLFFTKKDKQERSTANLLASIIQVIAGIFFIVKADFLVAFFPTVMALLLAYGAIVMIVRAIKEKSADQQRFTVSLVLGIVTLVLAVIVFVHPTLLANVMMQASGISMIIEGTSLLIVLSQKNHAE